MEEFAKVDPMTGLHNRRWLEEMYTREISRCNTGNISLTAFMLDIDHFKKVNDTFGHLAGDQVLMAIAHTLTESLRPSDMPVRYGGEEFSVFLPSTSMEDAKIVAERVRSRVEQTHIALPSGAMVHITISIGITERVADDTVAGLIERADKALYHAKQNGRNRCCINSGGDDLILL